MDNRLTHSQIRAYRTCPRKHQLLYVEGIKPEEDATALYLGTLVHYGLDLWKEGLMNGMPATALSRFVLGEVRARFQTTDERRLLAYQTAEALLWSYMWRWEEQDHQYEYKASEMVFEIPLINPATGAQSKTFTLSGKIDGLVKLPDGRLALIEHKTTGSNIDPEEDYWKRLRIDSQISLYFEAARYLGWNVETIVYDVIRKPRMRLSQIELRDEDGLKLVCDANGERVRTKDGKKWRESGDAAQGYVLQTREETIHEFVERLTRELQEKPESYFARREIPRHGSDLVEAQFERWQYAAMIRESRNANRWPRNDASCIGFGHCEFFGLCSNGQTYSDGDPVPPGFYSRKSVHEEIDEA